MLPRARMFAATLVALTVLAVWQLLTPARHRSSADDGRASRPDDAPPEAPDSRTAEETPAAGGEDPDPDEDDENSSGAAAEDATATEAERAAVAPFTLDDPAEAETAV